MSNETARLREVGIQADRRRQDFGTQFDPDRLDGAALRREETVQPEIAA